MREPDIGDQGTCSVCGDARYVVVGENRTLKPCPRYDVETKVCVG